MRRCKPCGDIYRATAKTSRVCEPCKKVRRAAAHEKIRAIGLERERMKREGRRW